MATANATAAMESLAQHEFVEFLKLGVSVVFRPPNRIYYLYRKNMLEPSLRDKYCKNYPYCIWCEIYDLETMKPISLVTKPVNDNQLAGWVAIADQMNADIK